MYVVEIMLLLGGIVLLVAGYRKHNRNWLLAGALALFASAALADLYSGFIAGLTG